ncbi:MAG: APC family permease [Pseudomonadota bacterium]
MNDSSLPRTIELHGAVFLVIGYVVGATIFILPGSLAEQVGPSVYLAYLFAAIPAVFACFVMALIGSAVPRSGSIYLMIRDVLSPVLGFMYLWLMVSLSAVVIPLVATGFADYFSLFGSGIDRTTVALAVVVLVMALNYFGMVIASGLQNILVIGFVLALLVFIFGGLVYGEAERLTPMFPKGFSPIVVAATAAYFSYAGVFVIAEVAGEIKEPSKNIPRAIFLSFAVIILLYTLVPMALSSILEWQSLGSTPVAVVTAARQVWPDWTANFIFAGALLAAFTSINGILMGLSRDFFMGAQSGIFPTYFGRVHPRFGTPSRAVFALGALSLAGVAMSGSVVQYAQIAVMGLMIVQIITGVALLKLPSKLPEVYAVSSFKLSPVLLAFVALAYIGFSLLFLLLLVLEQPGVVIPGVIFLLAGFVLHKFLAYRPGSRALQRHK